MGTFNYKVLTSLKNKLMMIVQMKYLCIYMNRLHTCVDKDIFDFSYNLCDLCLFKKFTCKYSLYLFQSFLINGSLKQLSH